MLLDLRTIIRQPVPKLLERIRRGKLAIFETVSGDGIEEIAFTGPPRIDRDTGDLLIGFRRPDDSLDVVVVNGDVDVERPISSTELRALLEGLKQAINDCGGSDNLSDVAVRYLLFRLNNRLPLEIETLILNCFPGHARKFVEEQWSKTRKGMDR
jgi:hypothetical protein